MFSIVIAFPKTSDAINIKNILVRHGYEVDAFCTTGAQAITVINELDAGILICGYRLKDMHYTELRECLPKGFEMLLLASVARLEEGTDTSLISLGMPLKVSELLDTVQMMTYNYRRQRRKERAKGKNRSPKDTATLNRAKAVLMERNHMTEEEAHHYIQKASMDSGVNLVEMAEMILSTNWEE